MRRTAGDLTRELILDSALAVRGDGRWRRPPLWQVAKHLNVGASTLKRALEDLGFDGWKAAMDELLGDWTDLNP